MCCLAYVNQADERCRDNDRTKKHNSYHGRTHLASVRGCFLQNVNKKVMSLKNNTNVRKQNGESGGNNRHTVNGSESVKVGSILRIIILDNAITY
ncbi:hypothetical protein Xenpb_01431 [Xenorhabdus sp. PB62.4]|nr:hypothetical protein [Xenorhabdus sp. PB62.4]